MGKLLRPSSGVLPAPMNRISISPSVGSAKLIPRSQITHTVRI